MDGLDAETILGRILTVRGRAVMLDADLADLYGTETKSVGFRAELSRLGA